MRENGQTSPYQNNEYRDGTLFILENQIRDNDPPEARETYQRLLKNHYTEEEAKQLMRKVIAIELDDIMTKHIPYNYERYIKTLNSLPDFGFSDF